MGARYGSLLMQQQQQAPPRPSRDWRDYFVSSSFALGRSSRSHQDEYR
jgi:hypothetical protein